MMYEEGWRLDSHATSYLPGGEYLISLLLGPGVHDSRDKLTVTLFDILVVVT